MSLFIQIHFYAIFRLSICIFSTVFNNITHSPSSVFTPQSASYLVGKLGFGVSVCACMFWGLSINKYMRRGGLSLIALRQVPGLTFPLVKNQACHSPQGCCHTQPHTHITDTWTHTHTQSMLRSNAFFAGILAIKTVMGAMTFHSFWLLNHM